MTISISRLDLHEVGEMQALNALFAREFEDERNYASNPPDAAYLAELLSRPHVIVLVARDGERIVGGLVAYVLEKLEQARSEVYIYDLAVAGSHRRRGVATGLIEALKPIARDHGAWVIFVQADQDDPPAIALYESLGVREDVLHFDIDVAGS